MEYLGAWGTLIHEKNLKSKISYQTPFNGCARMQRQSMSALFNFARHFNGCARMQRQHTRCWRTWIVRWILATISTILPAADSSVESSFPTTDPPGNGRLKRIIPARDRSGTRRLKSIKTWE